MDFYQLAHHACAICAHAIVRRDIIYVQPAQIDFTFLRNPALPIEILQ